jgi:hypothetical protein
MGDFGNLADETMRALDVALDGSRAQHSRLHLRLQPGRKAADAMRCNKKKRSCWHTRTKGTRSADWQAARILRPARLGAVKKSKNADFFVCKLLKIKGGKLAKT